jgi:hypothetical protein
MALRVEPVHVCDALAHVVGRAAEIDARIAAPLARTLVDVAVGILDEIDAADEEGEMQPLAVAVHLGGEIGQILPAFELGAVVERQHHELRRPFDLGRLPLLCGRSRHRHADGQHGQNASERHFPLSPLNFPAAIVPRWQGTGEAPRQLTLRTRSRTRANWN